MHMPNFAKHKACTQYQIYCYYLSLTTLAFKLISERQKLDLSALNVFYKRLCHCNIEFYSKANLD